MRNLSRFLLLLALAAAPPPGRAADPPTEAADIIRAFEKAWVVPKGSMRPLDDAGWKAHMSAFQKLAAMGGKAVPALTDALANGEPEIRVFAAQTLGLMADPKAKPALEAALKDKTPAVRLYALDALSMFGKLAPTDELKAMKEKDPNQDGTVADVPVSILVLPRDSLQAFPTQQAALRQHGILHAPAGPYAMVLREFDQNAIVVVGRATPSVLERVVNAYGSYPDHD